jgi:AcrR family transcriptional regulator
MATHSQRIGRDGRAERTRGWIVTSFNRLFRSRAYDRFDVSEVAQRAGVGRSTLYEHFRSKESILRSSITPVFEVFADAVLAGSDVERLVRTVEFIGTHRPEAHRMLTGAARPAILEILTELLGARLRTLPGREGEPAASIRLWATHLAHAQLGLVHAWTEPADEACSARDMGVVLDRTTKAIVATQVAGSPARGNA